MAIAVTSPVLQHRRSLDPRTWINPYRGMTPEAQVASALVMVSEVRQQSVRRRHMDWQDQALTYFDRVPEVAYSGEFYARSMPKLVLGVGRYEWDKKTGNVVVNTDPKAIPKQAQQVLEEFQDPGGNGREKFLASYGRLMFLVGDGYAVKSRPDDVTEWEFLSHKEFRVKPGTGPTTSDAVAVYQRLEAPGLPYEETESPPDETLWEDLDPNQTVCVRLWRPHPTYSWWAHSCMKALLGVCEELMLLEQAIHARLTARAAAGGILFIPNSIANSIPDTEPRTPEERQMTPMMKMIYRTFMTAIQQPGHPSASMPIVLTGPDSAGDQIKVIKLFDDTVAGWPEVANREKAVERFAMSADFPQEYLTGLEDLNHWNAWQVDDQTWETHLQPVSNMLVHDLSTACLRPQLIALGMDEDEAGEICFTYDESEVVTRPDKSEAAKAGHDRGIVGREAFLREVGLEPDDLMEDDEYAKWVGVQVKDAGMATSGIPTPKTGTGVPGGEIVPPQQPGEEDSPTAPGSPLNPATPPDQPDAPPPNTQDKPPATQGGRPVKLPNVRATGLSDTARILGAAEMTLLRCRELAGARLRSKANRTLAGASLDGVANTMVPYTIGRGGLQGQQPAEKLIAGGVDAFVQKLLEWGVEVAMAGYLGTAVERHAMATLYDADPIALPAELIVLSEA